MMHEDTRQWAPPEWKVQCPPPLGEVKIRELPLREIAQSLSGLTGLVDAAQRRENWNLTQAILQDPDAVVNAIAKAISVPADLVAALPAGKTLELLQALVVAHQAFFFSLALLRHTEKAALRKPGLPT